jgi:predicted aconitase with swiveling domain
MERQLVQIVQLAVDGDTDRASGLIAEHLAEFPGDQLIGRIQAWMSGRRRLWSGS